MKAVIYTEYGSPHVLKLTEIKKPSPARNEILVKVYASTVSAGSTWIRKGEYPGSLFFTIIIRLMYGIQRPRQKVLGFEFAGVVEEVGKDVKRFKKGYPVYGTTTGLKIGAYAEYICVPERWRLGVVTLKPDALTFEQAAALPVGGMTALQLLNKVKIKKDQSCLIYGASGSVGSYTVQLAKFFGAVVTGVCSTNHVELIKSLGADVVIDYTREDISQFTGKFDVIIDAVNKLPSSKLKSLLKRNGRFASVNSLTNERVEYLDFLYTLLIEQKVQPLIDRVYPIENIIEAHKYVDLGHKKGNVVIAIGSIDKP